MGVRGDGIEIDCKVCHLNPTLFYLVQIRDSCPSRQTHGFESLPLKSCGSNHLRTQNLLWYQEQVNDEARQPRDAPLGNQGHLFSFLLCAMGK